MSYNKVTYPDLDTRGENVDGFKNKMPEHSGAKDVIWAFLFIIHLIVILGLAVYGFRSMNNALDDQTMSSDNPLSDTSIPWKNVARIGLVIAVCVAAGACCATFWLFLMRKFPKQLIIGTMIVQAVLWIAMAVYMLYLGAILGGIIGLAGAICTMVMWWFWRHRIPFAAAILGTVASVTKQFPGTILVPFLCLFTTAGWSILWGYTSATSYYYASSGALGYVLYVFFLLSLYWTVEVIRNTGHTTVSGTFATWYFMGGDNANLPKNPTLKSGKRALTTSFGSICLGSFIVAAIQTVRAILRSLARQRSDNVAVQIIACLVDCILGCIEGLVRMFNKYAYVQVAIYGKSFCQAAKDTWRLAQSHGIDAIINESFIGPTLTIGALIGAIICFLVGAAAGAAIVATDPVPAGETDYTWVLFGLLGAIIGYIMMLQTMLVVDSGVATIFVCYAMDRSALHRNDPALGQMFDEAYNGKSAKKQRDEFQQKQNSHGNTFNI